MIELLASLEKLVVQLRQKKNEATKLRKKTEKQLKEFGDKIPAEKKEPIEAALAELKTAHEAKDFDAIDASMEKLNEVFQAASQDMYAQQGAEGAPEGAAQGDASSDGSDEEVTDVDFEEVEEEDEKEKDKA